MNKEDILKAPWFPAAKAGNRELIKAAGGIEAVARFLGCGKSVVGNWLNWDMADLMPVWAMIRLEEDRGRPILSGAYAELTGATVVDAEPDVVRSLCLDTGIAGMAASMGAVLTKYAIASADGHRSPAELRDILAQLDDAGGQIDRVKQAIHGLLGAGGAE